MDVSKIEEIFSRHQLKNLFIEQISKSGAVGKDGVRLAAFSKNLDRECEIIESKVLGATYKFTKYREKLILKGFDSLPRQISVPTVRDRLALRAVCNVLKNCFPKAIASPPHIYIKECAQAMRSAREHSSFLRMDIKNFYPSILHERMIAELREGGMPPFLIELIRRAIANPTGNSAENNEFGVPQGLSISNALAGVYLGKIDVVLSKKYFYKRYVDDILMISPSETVNEAYKEACAILNDVGLESHMLGKSGKTEVARISEGIQYLGYNLSPKIVSIRQSSYQRMFKNLSKILTQIKYRNLDEKTLFRLNLKISGCRVDQSRRGWLMFFAQTEDKSQLAFLDKFIKREISLLGYCDLIPRIKTFVKSYHEIRFNLENSKYIPNFDDFDVTEKTELVALLGGHLVEVVGTWNAQIIQTEFNRLLSREISELEKDVLSAAS